MAFVVFERAAPEIQNDLHENKGFNIYQQQNLNTVKGVAPTMNIGGQQRIELAIHGDVHIASARIKRHIAHFGVRRLCVKHECEASAGMWFRSGADSLNPRLQKQKNHKNDV